MVSLVLWFLWCLLLVGFHVVGGRRIFQGAALYLLLLALRHILCARAAKNAECRRDARSIGHYYRM
jgi:hypothetical protein